MNLITKTSNFLIFFVVCALFLILEPQKQFSLKLSSMLTGEDKKHYNILEEFNYVNTMIVAVKGEDKEGLKKIVQIKKELTTHPLITTTNALNNKTLQDFKEKYKFYLNKLAYENSEQIDVQKDIKNIYDMIMGSPFYVNINKEDPFRILKNEKIDTSSLKIKNGHLLIPGYGYVSFFKLNVPANERARFKIYNEIHDVLDKYKDIKFFSSVFYYVENSLKIKNDVSKIILISMILLGLLYLVMLKNIKLFINVAMTLITSVFVGQIVVANIFEAPSIIAIVFGTAVTSVSIDYMFHHYLHNYYNQKKGFNKPVFYGFLTTIISFILISFIDFPLIKQISIFTIVSLITAYLQFSLIFPHIGFKHKQPYVKENYKPLVAINSKYIIAFSLLVIVFAIFNVKTDFNVKNLDYQNKKLQEVEGFFKSHLNKSGKVTVIVEAKDIETLIENGKKLYEVDTNVNIQIKDLLSKKEYEDRYKLLKDFKFASLKSKMVDETQKVGLSKNFLSSCYSETLLFPEYPKYDMEMLRSMGIDMAYIDGKYLTYAAVTKEKRDEVLKLPFAKSGESKVLFGQSLANINDELLVYGTITIIFIISVLLVVSKRKIVNSLSYLLFPTSFILLYGCFYPLNIMHIFMFFIILAIGIDYGIYMTEKNLSHNTTLAIVYSLISTFAGFGVLAISDINSLFSIGIIAIIGILSIVFLLLFQKKISG